MTDAFEAWRDRARGAEILAVALRPPVGAILRGHGRERVGPCPRCSGDDGFSLNTAKQVFNCRRGGAGGDVVAMVQHVCAVEFLAACEIINGEPPPQKGTQLTEAQREAAARQLAESRRRAEAAAAADNRYRANVIEAARRDWAAARAFAGSSAEAYLVRKRGLAFPDDLDHADRLRCAEDMPYVVERGLDERGNKRFERVHVGPAKLAPIRDAAGTLQGLHITWLDLAAPKGKLQLADPQTGAALDPKKTRGSMKGNRVELIGPRAPRCLVLGEGDEKTIAVWRSLAWLAQADAERARALADTAFWSACNLGNLGTPHADRLRHPTRKDDKTGRAVTVAGPTPDFAKPAIVIPDSVTDLVLLGDSTSDDFETRVAMCRAAARYAAPGRTVRVAWAPAGIDFDDPWREAKADATRAIVAGMIAAIMDAAAPPVMPAIEAKPAARRRVSAEQRAAKPTGDAAAGAPIAPPASADEYGGEPPVPPADPSPAAAAPPPPGAEDENETSHRGRSGARWANRARWGGPPGNFGSGGDALNKWLATFPQTELGLVERYVQRWKATLCYCPALGWLTWDRRRWAREGAEGKAIAAGHDTVRAIQAEAEAIRGTDLDEIVEIKTRGKGANAEEIEIRLSDRLEGFGRVMETKSRMKLADDAKAYLWREVGAFDADHFAINILNGTLIVRRKSFEDAPLPRGWQYVNAHIRLKPHDPLDLITKLAPIAWDAQASCELYDQSLAVWQPAQSYRELLDVWNGYSMTGDASEQKFVLGIGTGKNGKSTWTSLSQKLLGDYCESIPITTLMDAGKARAAGQATPDLAMLRSIRMLLTSEPPKGWKVDEGLVKDLTGGDKVAVRELHKAYFKLDPRFKLTIAGNHKPEFSAGGKESGIWRRTVLLDWKVVIPEEQRDPRLVDKLVDEASGILNRWLAGLTRWLAHGLVIPQEVVAATEQYRADRDILGRFLSECAELREGEVVAGSLVYDTFVAWVRAGGESGRHDWTQNGLTKALKERGFGQVKRSTMHWLGFRLIKFASDFGGSSSAGAAPPDEIATQLREEILDDAPF